MKIFPLIANSLKYKQKVLLLEVVLAVLTCHTGLQKSHVFPGLVYNLGATTPPRPHPPSEINNKAARPKRVVFPFWNSFFLGGEGVNYPAWWQP